MNVSKLVIAAFSSALALSAFAVGSSTGDNDKGPRDTNGSIQLAKTEDHMKAAAHHHKKEVRAQRHHKEALIHHHNQQSKKLEPGKKK